MKISEKTIAYAKDKIGYRYSQAERMRKDAFDCSSLVFRAYKDAGYDFLHNKDCQGLTSSMYLVQQTDFDILWPTTGRKNLGQQFTSMTELKKQGYRPQAGDIVYFCTQAATTRSNKITHVALVESDKTMIHARSTFYGVRRDVLTLYDTTFAGILKNGNVVAVARLVPDKNRSEEQNDKTEKYVLKTVKTNGGTLNVRESPSTTAKILTKLTNGTTVNAKMAVSGWCAIKTKTNKKEISGYVSSIWLK